MKKSDNIKNTVIPSLLTSCHRVWLPFRVSPTIKHGVESVRHVNAQSSLDPPAFQAGKSIKHDTDKAESTLTSGNVH